MKTAIVIPARFGSKRLPGKPLRQIAGVSMLERVVRIAKAAAQDFSSVKVIVATDDKRIAHHCEEIGAEFVMTAEALPTGTDRVAEAVDQLLDKPDFVLNLQGDAPLTPPEFLSALMAAFQAHPCDVVTPVTQLSWTELDRLRQNKEKTPFSGTSAVFNQNTGQAFWFSKNIVPAIRNEEDLRKKSQLSPIFRHIGLYGYSSSMLQAFIKLQESPYEQLEGLEQLRLLEHGYDIRCVPVEFKGRANMSGIDSEEDIARAEALIATHGEILR